MATFRNTKGIKTGFVPSVGLIVDGLLKNAPEDFENAAFERLEEPAPTPAPQPVTPQPAAPTAPAAPVASPVTTPPEVTPTPQPTQTNQETN